MPFRESDPQKTKEWEQKECSLVYLEAFGAAFKKNSSNRMHRLVLAKTDGDLIEYADTNGVIEIRKLKMGLEICKNLRWGNNSVGNFLRETRDNIRSTCYTMCVNKGNQGIESSWNVLEVADKIIWKWLPTWHLDKDQDEQQCSLVSQFQAHCKTAYKVEHDGQSSQNVIYGDQAGMVQSSSVNMPTPSSSLTPKAVFTKALAGVETQMEQAANSVSVTGQIPSHGQVGFYQNPQGGGTAPVINQLYMNPQGSQGLHRNTGSGKYTHSEMGTDQIQIQGRGQQQSSLIPRIN